jgi:hypothetical protein
LTTHGNNYFIAPAGTLRPIVDRVNASVRKTLGGRRFPWSRAAA